MSRKALVLTKRLKEAYLLFLIAILFVVSAGASLSLLNKSQDLLLWNERASGRALVQLVILQQSYITLLIQLTHGESVEQQLVTAYDLTWSAYDVLLEGSKNAYFINDGRRIAKLKNYFSQFQESDPINVQLSGDLLIKALHDAQHAHSYGVQLLNHEFQGYAQETHQRDFELVRLNKIMIMGLLGLTFSGGFFLIVIIRERRHMAYLAYHDPLTKIGNRSALQRKISTLQSQQVKFSALLIDIDRFKLINDKFGHDVGDKLLVFVIQKMSKVCGELNFIGRLGGDEFAIIYLGKNSVEQLALELLAITENIIQIQDSSCDIDFSIGISYSSLGHKTWVDILKEADNAMYQAKGNGGNQYQIYDVNNLSSG